jgi:subtilisin-like proprotein convertase family protein
VARAATWTNVGPQVAAYDSGEQMAGGVAFNDNDMAGATNAITVTGSPIERIEYVSVYLTETGGDVGDLDVRLEGSGGTASLLAEPHNCFASNREMNPLPLCGGAYGGWRFGSARHLGESANQTWTVRVSDRRQGNTAGGTLVSWRLVIEGRAR